MIQNCCFGVTANVPPRAEDCAKRRGDGGGPNLPQGTWYSVGVSFYDVKNVPKSQATLKQQREFFKGAMANQGPVAPTGPDWREELGKAMRAHYAPHLQFKYGNPPSDDTNSF